MSFQMQLVDLFWLDRGVEGAVRCLDLVLHVSSLLADLSQNIREMIKWFWISTKESL